ncbi:MAG: phenylacetic acid degradation operon negative regulatory protein [Parcubacteria group bacterium Gr01-1014_56]|nr:MAG: phenylacetic acid degradation operon negative regulatory protein [Parcubacteria group bacterium Gr01-1014_56]
MGILEKEYKRKKQRANLQKAVLNTVATAGVVSIALVAPNVLGALGTLGILPTKRRTESIQTARKRLVERGLLLYEGKNIHLTKAGEAVLRSLSLPDYKLPKPRRWDKRWRVLIFDIPEKRKSLREKVRRTLNAIGFIRLQDSVWVYPYDCEDFVTLLKADFKIGKDLLYMIVDTLEHDTPLRKKFDLK